MRAFQVSEFYQLMAHKSRIAIRDHQMSLAFSYRQSRKQFSRIRAACVHNARSVKLSSIVEPHFACPCRAMLFANTVARPDVYASPSRYADAHGG